MKDHLHPQVLSAIDVKPGIDVVKAGKGAVYTATDGDEGKPMPFDMKRMTSGGFTVLVDL